MASTFNRMPVSVNTSNISQPRYFNHYNWKGINQNENFLLVDQETFSDAENVYIDDVGLLSSRPPIKFKHKFENKEVVDVKTFDECLIIIFKIDGQYELNVIRNNSVVNSRKIVSSNVKMFKRGSMIYFFTDDVLFGYDIEKNVFNGEITYAPVTRIYSGSNYQNNEDDNLFSSKNRYQYILASNLEDNANVFNSNIYGKEISYRHFLNEEKIQHTIYADRENKFLNTIHQPLIYDASFFTTTNCYNVEVPTAFIHNKFLYKYENNVVYRASVSDMIFEKICECSLDDRGSFVKFKLQPSNRIMILYSHKAIFIDLDGSNEEIYTHMTDSMYPHFLLDLCELKYNGTTHKIVTVVSADLVDNSYSGKYKLEIDFINIASFNSNSYKLELNEVSSENQIIGHAEMSMLYSDKFTYGYGAQGVSIHCNILNEPVVCFMCLPLYYQISNVGTFYGCSIFGDGPTFTFNAYEEFSDDTKSLPSFDVTDDKVFVGLPTKIYNTTYRYYYGEINNNNGYNVENLMHIDDCRKVLYNGSIYYISHGKFNTIINDREILISNLCDDFTLNSNSDYWFYFSGVKNIVLSNYRTISTLLYLTISKHNDYPGVDVLFVKDKIYFSKGSTLYVGDIVFDDWNETNKLWFKKSLKNDMDFIINGFHSINDDAVAIFTTENTWYSIVSEGLYYYNKSKIVPTLKGKSDIITLSDSSTTLVPSNDGIVAMNYQNFVSTFEQSTVNLTQDLKKIYQKFSSNIQIVNWKNYTIFYNNDLSKFLIFDVRNSSWWKWNFNLSTVRKLIVYENDLYLFTAKNVYKFDLNNDDYTDEYELDLMSQIDWYFESQKLHLNANNFYKHIDNLTLYSVEKNDKIMSMNLNTKNYRKYVNDGKAENFEYDIDVLRTYVKRLNYAKVSEFQYKLSSDNSTNKSPLGLSNITLKYKIGGQIR